MVLATVADYARGGCWRVYLVELVGLCHVGVGLYQVER